MSKYYKGKRIRNIYDPDSKKPFKLSRSRLDLFLNCPQCLYIDRRLGVDKPPGYPFNINSTVDALLKNEFDHYRSIKKPHLLMTENGVDGIPFEHKLKDDWVEKTIINASRCLISSHILSALKDCDYCHYRSEGSKIEENLGASE